MWFLWFWEKLTDKEHSSYLWHIRYCASLSSEFFFYCSWKAGTQKYQWKEPWFEFIFLWSRNWVRIIGTVFFHLLFLTIPISVLFLIFYIKIICFRSHLVIRPTSETQALSYFYSFSFITERKYNDVPHFNRAFLFAGFLWQTLWFMYLWSELCRRWQFNGMSLALGI